MMSALNDNRLMLRLSADRGCGARKAEHYECLLRMRARTARSRLPGDFIPAAETLGLVRLVDRRALEMAVAQLYAPSERQARRSTSRARRRAIQSWLQSFINYVRENREVAERMTVELTETAALQALRGKCALRHAACATWAAASPSTISARATPRSAICTICASTWSRSTARIVKNLCDSPDNQIFVRTLVDLAKNFQLETVAEWVGSEKTRSSCPISASTISRASFSASRKWRRNELGKSGSSVRLRAA